MVDTLCISRVAVRLESFKFLESELTFTQEEDPLMIHGSLAVPEPVTVAPDLKAVVGMS